MSHNPMSPTGLQPVTAAALQAAVARIVRVLHPEKGVLFGSYAYGTPTPNSDVDLLVVETDATPADRCAAVSQLLYPRPFPVDILVKTPDEIVRGLAGGDFFLTELLSRGRVLYERGH